MNPNAAFVNSVSSLPNSLPTPPFPTNPSAPTSAPAAPVVGKEEEGEENGERAEEEEGRRDETKSMWQLPPGYSSSLPSPHQYLPQYNKM